MQNPMPGGTPDPLDALWLLNDKPFIFFYLLDGLGPVGSASCTHRPSRILFHEIEFMTVTRSGFPLRRPETIPTMAGACSGAIIANISPVIPSPSK
jgi:hypothetical protein